MIDLQITPNMKSLGIEKIPAEAGSLSDYNNGMTERRFSPYSDNGGSVVAIAGENYVVIASDTRLSGHGWVHSLFQASIVGWPFCLMDC